MAGLSLTREDDADPQTVRALSDGLDGYNAAFLPGSDLAPKPRHLVWRDAAGAVQGGVRYYVALEWAVVEWLWLAEPFRRAGLGGQLLDGVEADARAQNCRGVYLDTFSFQAPRFYQKRGYFEFGRVPDMPAGSDRIWMMKRLR